MKYWRTMIIALALGAFGLGVWADDSIRGDNRSDAKPAVAAVKPPTSDPRKDDVMPFPPATAVPEPADLEPPARVIELVASPPVAPPVVPPLPDPLKADKLALDLPRPQAPPPLSLSNDPPPIPKSALDLPPMPSLPKASEPKLLELPKSPLAFDSPRPPMIDLPKPVDRPAPTALLPLPPSPYPPAPPSVTVVETRPPTKPVPPASASKPGAGAYKLHVHMGGMAGPRFEIRDGESQLLKVYCEKIELHAVQEGSTALPGLTASGKVRVSGSGVNGTCDSLTLTSVKGEVLLKGDVRITCYRGNSSSQIVAESMSFQLKGTDEVPSKARPSGKSGVVPASN